LHREAVTDDPSLKNIATSVTASPLWERGKMHPDVKAGKTVEDTHSRRDQAMSMNVISTIKVDE